ncbi:hypothetical protein [Tsukamurella spumae]|uniref:DUF2029 domain-containing protein n=1 Tax=Tsukamurella spumae TaxID=44753 RepID=A0A846WXI1_9ACTN|nr:hypothetical protein [Tsukamurella spumae]NKY17693.1 hypothetical protein [Tsukamurella spumae]
MSADTKLEEFILAPSDPAWGDERNRDEYYRANAIGSFWSVYAFFGVAVVAAAEGAVAAALLALIAPGVIQMTAVQRYCRRHEVPLSQVLSMFNRGRRRWISLATTIPLGLAALILILLHEGGRFHDPGTLAGGLVGAVVGAGAAFVAFRVLASRERRSEERAAAEDDVFE